MKVITDFNYNFRLFQISLILEMGLEIYFDNRKIGAYIHLHTHTYKSKNFNFMIFIFSENLICNDICRSRIQRLVNVLKYYTNRDKKNSSINVTCKNGLEFTEPTFDKVILSCFYFLLLLLG